MSNMSYIGRKRDCGCVVCVITDDPQDRRCTADQVAGWIRDGLIVERVTREYVKEHFATCPHGQQALPGLDG